MPTIIQHSPSQTYFSSLCTMEQCRPLCKVVSLIHQHPSSRIGAYVAACGLPASTHPNTRGFYHDMVRHCRWTPHPIPPKDFVPKLGDICFWEIDGPEASSENNWIMPHTVDIFVKQLQNGQHMFLGLGTDSVLTLSPFFQKLEPRYLAILRPPYT